MMVSVIIPTHNRRHYLSECVKSVINQTFSDREILIIDDHSSDDTHSLVQQLINEYGKCIKYIRMEKGRGPSAARNTGLQHASGEYVAFLDSDDLWDKDNLKLKMRIFDSERDIDAVLSDASFFGEVENGYMEAPYKDELFKDKFWVMRSKLLSVARISIIPFVLEKGSPFRIQSLILRKQLLSTVGNFNEDLRYYEDADFIIRCFCAGKVGYLHDKLCRIRRHALNTDNIVELETKNMAELAVVKNVFEYANKLNINIDMKFMKVALRNAYIRRASAYFFFGNLDKAKTSLWESIKVKSNPKAIVRLIALSGLSLLPRKAS